PPIPTTASIAAALCSRTAASITSGDGSPGTRTRTHASFFSPMASASGAQWRGGSSALSPPTSKSRPPRAPPPSGGFPRVPAPKTIDGWRPTVNGRTLMRRSALGRPPLGVGRRQHRPASPLAGLRHPAIHRFAPRLVVVRLPVRRRVLGGPVQLVQDEARR